MSKIVPLMTSATAHTLGYVGRTPGTAVRDSDAWYTPPEYIDCAREVMGSIDFDPFSSERANAIIRARHYLTPECSALTHKWRNAKRKRDYPHGLNVWMNPPYSSPMISQATDAFLHAYDHGDIAQAIVLVNNATETHWFRLLRQSSLAVCFPTHRIAFVAPDGKSIGGNTRAQVFFYYGTKSGSQRFIQYFQGFGWAIHQEDGWNTENHNSKVVKPIPMDQP